MSLQSFLSGLISGVAIFLVVAAVVTELARPWVAVSLLVGVPAGLIAGGVIAMLVHRLGRTDPVRSQRMNAIVGTFAGSTLAVFFFLRFVLDIEIGVAIGSAVGVGAIVGVLVFVRQRTS